MLSIVRLSAVDRSEGEGDGIGVGRLVGKIGGQGVVEVAGAAGAVEGGRGGHPREGGVVGNGRGNRPGLSTRLVMGSMELVGRYCFLI